MRSHPPSMRDQGAPVLVTRGLTKAYGHRLAVNGLDLEVRAGEVFGFLGPNGAGKTTTIRMLAGLVRPTAGRIEILGRDLGAHASEILPRVGALIETAAAYPHLSGRDNLRAFASVLGGVSPARLDEVLDLVGLCDRQRDRAGPYSLGMRQRLGLAIALINDPELLLLDEPATGLDPAGFVEMRDLLRHLAVGGKTLFISSHLLTEVARSCDRVAIIDHGRLLRLGAIDEFVQRSGEFEVRLSDPADGLRQLRRYGWGATARLTDGVLVVTSPTGRGRDLLDLLTGAGIHPDGVVERRDTLEEVFLRLTAEPGEAH